MLACWFCILSRNSLRRHPVHPPHPAVQSFQALGAVGAPSAPLLGGELLIQQTRSLIGKLLSPCQRGKSHSALLAYESVLQWSRLNHLAQPETSVLRAAPAPLSGRSVHTPPPLWSWSLHLRSRLAQCSLHTRCSTLSCCSFPFRSWNPLHPLNLRRRCSTQASDAGCAGRGHHRKRGPPRLPPTAGHAPRPELGHLF